MRTKIDINVFRIKFRWFSCAYVNERDDLPDDAFIIEGNYIYKVLHRVRITMNDDIRHSLRQVSLRINMIELEK